MVGGGIFAVLGVVAGDAEGGAPLAFLLAGVIALLTASSYARLSVKYPSRGGSVVFIDRAFGVRVATGALNNLLWIGYLVTLSLYAVAFANYAETFVPSGQPVAPWAHHLLISAAILVPTALNLLSAARVAQAETAIVVLKLVMLVVVCAFGATTIDASSISVASWPSITAIASAGMLVFVAYEGFELIANSAEDIKRPRRNLPRALYTSVILVIVIYVVVAAVTVGSLSPTAISRSSDFALAEAAKPSLGQFGFVLVAASAVLATFSAINATLYGAARLSYSIAVEGELPPSLERQVWSEPVGLLITAAASLLIANTLDVVEISSLASAVFLIVFASVNAASLRVCSGGWAKRIAPTLGALGCVASLTLLLVDSIQTRPVAVWILGGLLLSSLFGEVAWLRHMRPLSLGN